MSDTVRPCCIHTTNYYSVKYSHCTHVVIITFCNVIEHLLDVFENRVNKAEHLFLYENQKLWYVFVLMGYCTSYPKISMFCALSQNYQHLEKEYVYIL